MIIAREDTTTWTPGYAPSPPRLSHCELTRAGPGGPGCRPFATRPWVPCWVRQSVQRARRQQGGCTPAGWVSGAKGRRDASSGQASEERRRGGLLERGHGAWRVVEGGGGWMAQQPLWAILNVDADETPL